MSDFHHGRVDYDGYYTAHCNVCDFRLSAVTVTSAYHYLIEHQRKEKK